MKLFFRVILPCLLLAPFLGHTQSFIGPLTDNHTGVPMMNVQPASIVNSPWKWDVHPLGAGFTAVNSSVFDAISAAIDGNPFPFIDNTDEFQVTLDLQLPSFLLRINDRMAVGFESKFRGNLYTESNDSELLSLFLGGFNDEDLVGLSINDGLLSGRGHFWWEVAGTFAYQFLDQREHSLSGGLTLRYLGGMANAYINTSNLSFVYSDEEQLSEVDGTLEFVYNRNLNALSGDENFKLFSDPGFGASLGAEYIWAPNNDGYALKLGIGVLDMGKIVYDQSPFSGRYVANNILVDIDDLLDSEDLDELSRKLADTFEEVVVENENYTVYMPTKLAIQADYRIAQSIYYLNFSAYITLRNNNREVRNTAFFSNYILTPRLEKRTWGIQVPILYNPLTKVTAGLGFRLGPVYFSSQNIIGLLVNGDQTKRFDMALGFRFGGRY